MIARFNKIFLNFILLVFLALFCVNIFNYFDLTSTKNGDVVSYSAENKIDEVYGRYSVAGSTGSDSRADKSRLCEIGNGHRALEEFFRGYKKLNVTNGLGLFRNPIRSDPIVRVRKNDHYFILDPQKKLHLTGIEASAATVEPILLLNMVTISAADFKRRMTIRNSWGNPDAYESPSLTRTVFVCGLSNDKEINQQLRYESYLYSDIIQADFIDSYYNLTMKTLLAFKWAASYYNTSTLKFILKIDDDVIPNMDALLAYLNELVSQQLDGWRNSVLGIVKRKSSVIRRVASKYYVSEAEYKPNVYPAFCLGPAYIVTTDLATRISEENDHQGFLKLEDVYVTGIIGSRLNASYIDLLPRYLHKPDSRTATDSGVLSMSLFTFPIKDSNAYLKIWRRLFKCY